MIAFIEEKIVSKGWGYEVILHNKGDYCAKLLRFHKGGKVSSHYHLLKTETWYVSKGTFELIYYNTDTAERLTRIIPRGTIIEVEKGSPHQLIALEDSEIFEASTMHYDYDSYRIEKGDSQL